jgi:hypothetical protein
MNIIACEIFMTHNTTELLSEQTIDESSLRQKNATSSIMMIMNNVDSIIPTKVPETLNFALVMQKG